MKLRDLRVKKQLERLRSFIFYIVSSACGYYVFSETDFFPSIIGGNGPPDALKNVYRNYPTYDANTNKILKYYVSLTFGYHFYSTYVFFADHSQNARTDFLSMYAHHFSTILLVVLSYMAGYNQMGCLINFLHDQADITLSILKVILESKYKITSVVMAIVNTIVWWITRCYLLPIVVYQTIFVYLDTIWIIDGKLHEDRMYIKPYVYLASVFLGCLIFLHWYWFLLFLKGFYVYATKGKVDDPVSTVKKQEKKENKKD